MQFGCFSCCLKVKGKQLLTFPGKVHARLLNDIHCLRGSTNGWYFKEL